MHGVKPGLKGMAVMLCTVLLCCFVGATLSARADDTLDSLQQQASKINDRLKELEGKKKQIQGQITSAKTQKEKEQATKNYLDDQIAITQEELELIGEAIANLSEEISVKEQEIERKQAEYDVNYDTFRQRLRVMYMYGENSTLGLLLGTENMVDFLSKTDTLTRVARHDRDLMRKLTAERVELEDQRADLSARKLAQEDLHAQAEDKRNTLTVQLQAAVVRIQDMSNLQKQFETDLAKAEAEAKAMEAELKEVYRQIEWSKNPYIGGVMRWPVDNYTKITSYYGWRFNNTDFHTGIDISGSNIYNKPVRAANAGTVKVANWSYTPGRGYGIYVIIDHGGKISTLYGHLCNITVKAGDVVARGDQIGNVGSTGWSTGPHLHFEVREGSNHKDPLPYLKG